MKRIRNLPTLLAGIIIGLGLSFSPQIYAATSQLLGKEVDKVMEVELNSKTIGQAAVMEGTSYLPVRALADGLELKIEVTKEKIILSSPTGEELKQKADEEQAATDKLAESSAQILVEIGKTKNSIKKQQSIQNNGEAIKSLTGRLETLKSLDKEYPGVHTEGIKNLQNELARLNSASEKAAEEVKILEAKLTDLEAQLAALEE